MNGWKWQLLRARILGDEAQLQLGEDTNVVKHQPKLHWTLSVFLVRNALLAAEARGGFLKLLPCTRRLEQASAGGEGRWRASVHQVFQEVWQSVPQKT